jgi:pimeloyl-ACP methyl ester carboxylesterase
LVEATLREVRLDPRLDGSRIALLGLGLGGAPVVRAAGVDPAIGAVVVVSPPFDPTRWPHHAGALAASPFPDDAQGRELAGSFALGEAIEGLTTPLLVFGGGYDQVAPPAEAERVACAAGEWATLVWYPTGGHLLWEARDDWPLVATAWLATLFAADQEAGDVEETPEGSGDTTDGTAGAGRAGAVGWGDHAPPEWSGLGPGEVGDVDETDGDAWADDLAWGTPAGAPPREPFSD